MTRGAAAADRWIARSDLALRRAAEILRAEIARLDAAIATVRGGARAARRPATLPAPATSPPQPEPTVDGARSRFSHQAAPINPLRQSASDPPPTSAPTFRPRYVA